MTTLAAAHLTDQHVGQLVRVEIDDRYSVTLDLQEVVDLGDGFVTLRLDYGDDHPFNLTVPYERPVSLVGAD